MSDKNDLDSTLNDPANDNADPAVHSQASPPVIKDDRQDRSFNSIADHFEKKVYGGLKGDIRLAVLRRDIFEYVEAKSQDLGRPLRILDVGAGLAQIALALASQGHDVVINDIAENMLDKAKARFEVLKADALNKAMNDTEKAPAFGDVSWYVCPYQALSAELADTDKFDVILCHALLEWLAQPIAIMEFFNQHLTDNGALSLCFYNPASFDYRNLIMGNFNLLDSLVAKDSNQADNKKSLTPNYPVAKQEVECWLMQHDYEVLLESGLRVFHDYAPLKRGGHNDPEAVIRMELRYSRQEPYKRLGRYLHVLARR